MGHTTTLGDLSISPGNGGEWTGLMAGAFSMLFLNEDCGTMMAMDVKDKLDAIAEGWDEDYGDADLAFTFIGGHWYLADDVDDQYYRMDDFEIPVGQGVILNAFGSLNNGAKMVCSGQVSKDYQYASASRNTYVLSGNVAPADMTLADFELTAGDGSDWTGLMAGAFSMLFLNEKCGTMMALDVKDMLDAIAEGWDEDYGDADLAFTFIDGHWYLADDVDDQYYCMDDYPIPAGQGFILNAFGSLTKGVKIALPPAL